MNAKTITSALIAAIAGFTLALPGTALADRDDRGHRQAQSQNKAVKIPGNGHVNSDRTGAMPKMTSNRTGAIPNATPITVTVTVISTSSTSARTGATRPS